MCVLITGWAGWPWAGAEGGGRAGSRVPLDGGRDTKQRGEDEAVVSADLQTNEHASEPLRGLRVSWPSPACQADNRLF